MITQVTIRPEFGEPIYVSGAICNIDGDEIANFRTRMTEFFSDLLEQEVDVLMPELGDE